MKFKNIVHIQKSNVIFFLCLVPTLAAVFGMLVYPFISSIVMSFTNKLFQHREYCFIGLNNYKELMTDPVFWLSLKNSVKLTFIVVIANLAIGLPIALLLNNGGRYVAAFRTILFIPWLVPSTVTATVFKWIFNSHYGYLNYYLMKLSIIKKPLQIMSDESMVWWALSVSVIWGSFPFVTLVLSAALKSIESDLYTVACLDGANPIQLFRYITFPNIRNSIVIIIILQIIWEMSNYDMVKLMTDGGPGKATYTLSMYMFEEAFYAKRLGYAGAVGAMFFLMIFIFSMAYYYVMQRKKE